MSLRAAPHRVTIYRRGPAGKSTGGRQLVTWAQVATDVPFDVQLTTGTVAQRDFGRESEARYEAFAPTGTDLRPDDGVQIDSSDLASMVGRRFQVRAAMDWGARGGVQAVVVDTPEEFGS